MEGATIIDAPRSRLWGTVCIAFGIVFLASGLLMVFILASMRGIGVDDAVMLGATFFFGTFVIVVGLGLTRALQVVIDGEKMTVKLRSGMTKVVRWGDVTEIKVMSLSETTNGVFYLLYGTKINSTVGVLGNGGKTLCMLTSTEDLDADSYSKFVHVLDSVSKEKGIKLTRQTLI